MKRFWIPVALIAALTALIGVKTYTARRAQEQTIAKIPAQTFDPVTQTALPTDALDKTTKFVEKTGAQVTMKTAIDVDAALQKQRAAATGTALTTHLAHRGIIAQHRRARHEVLGVIPDTATALATTPATQGTSVTDEAALVKIPTAIGTTHDG